MRESYGSYKTGTWSENRKKLQTEINQNTEQIEKKSMDLQYEIKSIK